MSDEMDTEQVSTQSWIVLHAYGEICELPYNRAASNYLGFQVLGTIIIASQNCINHSINLQDDIYHYNVNA